MIIGVTGSLATGTSTAARYIAGHLKADIIHADKIAHKLLDKKDSLENRIILAFNRDILTKAGVIDRKKLADEVFKTKKNINKLSNILHPLIIAEIDKKIKSLYRKKPNSYIVVDGPVLIESKFNKECDKLVVIMSSLSLQITRAKDRKSLNKKQALSRIHMQMPLCKKARYADYVIDNGGNLKELKSRCKEVSNQLKSDKNSKKRSLTS